MLSICCINNMKMYNIRSVLGIPNKIRHYQEGKIEIVWLYDIQRQCQLYQPFI